MKKLLSRLFLLLLFLPLMAAAEDFPEKSKTLVTDYASVLSAEQRMQLEANLVRFNDSTSTQIAVVILRSVGSYDISDYSVQLFNRWKIGQEQKNNGILLLIALEDRKMFITTGYGLEGVLPDALCKRIITREITPYFKVQDYFGGIMAGTEAIMQTVKGEYTADRRGGQPPKSIAFFIFLIVFLVAIVLGTKIWRVRQYSATNHIGFWAAWALLNAASYRHHRHPGGFYGGGGWGSSGGGFGGGGFGGFGGGMSGGGGAGGSW